MVDFRTLVIGTTADYIAAIHERYPGRVLFITDKSQALRREMPDLDSRTQLLCDLSVTNRVIRSVERHLEQWNIRPRGITCYDCEWLVLTAKIAQALQLTYPSAESVALCRDKMASKEVWLKAGVPCPQASIVSSPDEASQFALGVGSPVVLKPVSGSGSELTFVCDDPATASRMFKAVAGGLQRRAGLPMFARVDGTDEQSGEPQEVIAEEFIKGVEFSCDVFVDNGNIEIIRLAEKIPRPAPPFGTTLAYIVPGRLPQGIDESQLHRILFQAASSLGLLRSLFMVDFIVRDGQIYLLELTPRPGGDCLPHLIKQSSGLDMLGLALDIAEKRPMEIPSSASWKKLVGLRLFAGGSGRIKRLDTTNLEKDPRVREIYFKRVPGEQVALPPKDYDTWILGHVIFEPNSLTNPDVECDEIAAKFKAKMARQYDDKRSGNSTEDSRTPEEANTTA